MEYAAVGLPVVASDVVPYSSMIRHGIDGLLTPNEPEAWAESLGSLIVDRDLRTRLVSAAGARVEEEFIARTCAFDQLPWDQWNGHQDRARSREVLCVSANGIELEI
jgi:glycosyltransferase involved in cell wall biosynthesis